MHELSIASSLVETAGQSAIDAGATRVLTVHLRLGPPLRGGPRALEFSHDIATTDGGRIAGHSEVPLPALRHAERRYPSGTRAGDRIDRDRCAVLGETGMAEHTGLGLMGIKERVDMLSARLSIRSRPDDGTEIVVRALLP